MRGLQIFLALVGRIFLSVIFILSAIHKIINWAATERYLVTVVCDWSSYVSHNEGLARFFTAMIPWAPFFLVLGVIVELIGALMVLFGIKVRFGAFLLFIFLIPVTIFLHQFWFLEGLKKDMQEVMFLKNIAIMGGLLYVMVFGSKIHAKGHHLIENPDLRE